MKWLSEELTQMVPLPEWLKGAILIFIFDNAIASSDSRVQSLYMCSLFGSLFWVIDSTVLIYNRCGCELHYIAIGNILQVEVDYLLQIHGDKLVWNCAELEQTSLLLIRQISNLGQAVVRGFM
jgi:hypothetical protein